MNLAQIICKTVITTVDICLILASIKTDSSKRVLKPFLLFTFINLVGVWI